MPKSRQELEEDAIRRTPLLGLPEEVKEIVRAKGGPAKDKLEGQEMFAEILDRAGEMPKDRKAVEQRMERRKQMRQASPTRKSE